MRTSQGKLDINIGVRSVTSHHRRKGKRYGMDIHRKRRGRTTYRPKSRSLLVLYGADDGNDDDDEQDDDSHADDNSHL